MRALMLFTRDLRVADQPALFHAAASAEHVLPLFVFDEDLFSLGYAVPNRASFLLDCLNDLRSSLQRLGGDLIVRKGNVVAEVMALAKANRCSHIFMSRDYSRYAVTRMDALEAAASSAGIEVRAFEGISVVAPGALAPAGGSYFKVFSPYWRRWSAELDEAPLGAPASIRLPSGVDPGPMPSLADLCSGTPSPDLLRGGEAQGRQRWSAWSQTELHDYESGHNDLQGDVTSRLSPFLHFGAVSPRELATEALATRGGEGFARQICWRDFYLQTLAEHPSMPTEDLKDKGDRWVDDLESLEAWKRGETGYPIVDAGMRQLLQEGWMHNRARLITASFLVKDLHIDWREGARHFFDLLVDGDVANNAGNWQWVAGTGPDQRPDRILSPFRQAERFDPEGEYVRRYVKELRGLPGKLALEPWSLPPREREKLNYPDQIVDHQIASRAFKAGRSAARSRPEEDQPKLFP